MERKQKIIMAGVLVLVVVLIVTGIIFFANGKKAKKGVQPEKKPTVEIENKDKQDQEQEEKPAETEKTEELDDSKAVSMKTTTNVNLRKEPNTDCEIIKVIPKGTELKKYSEEDGWAKVKCDEDIGYVSAEYLVDPSQVLEEPETPVPEAPKTEAIPGQHRNPNSAVVVIDPGHQRRGDNTVEPNGPGSSTMKARVTGGTSGVATGIAEYILTLEISLKLKTELENRGYTVYMTRTSHDVNISNMERAQYATKVGADIAVRIHANGSTNSAVNGAEVLVPSASNPYISHLSNASFALGRNILDAYCAATGFQKRTVYGSDTMTGINWSTVPVAILEMGYMSNPAEDRAMQDATMQNNMVQGIANGIDAYFGF